jgi:hypothetical protein
MTAIRIPCVLLVAAVLAAGRSAAQEVLGRVSGTVTDSGGAAVGGAHVVLAGTAFGAVTDASGRYLIERVPAGSYTIQAVANDAVTLERAGVLVPEGGRVLVDLSSAVPSQSPSPGHDDLTARGTIPGDMLDRLPIDDPGQALALVPGVVLRGSDRGIAAPLNPSIRGSDFAQTSVYVDGAPVRFEMFGAQQLRVGTGSLEETSVTSGVPGVLALDGGGGVLSYVTRRGGPRLEARFRAESDEPFGAGSAVGYNRFEAAVGGPLWSVPRLSWFVSAALQGQRSEYGGIGAEGVPTYVPAGLDTVVTVTQSSGATLAIPVPRFVQASGGCGELGGAGSPLARAIQANYGFACTGLRRPFDWSTARRGHAKLFYSYGAGSSVVLSGVVSDFQQRFFPAAAIGDPLLYSGARAWSRVAVLNWSHLFGSVAGGPLALNANMSIGSDHALAGLVDPASELATRAPGLGIEFTTLTFTGADVLPFPLSDQIIRNFRTNSGLRVPYLNRSDLLTSQPYRLNPYGLLLGWPTSGVNGSIDMVSERRLHGRWYLEWRPGPAQRVTVGVERAVTDVTRYASNLLSEVSSDAFVEHPRRTAVFASDRISLQDLTIDVGARYDHLAPGGEFARTPGFIFSDPAWNGLAATSDTAYANSVARVFTPAQGHHYLSPRLRLSYALSSATSVRLAYGQQLDPVPLSLLFGHVNNDLSFTNTFDHFARDVAYAKSALMEFGARHAFTSDLALEVSGYRKTDLAPYEYRSQSFPNPLNPGTRVSVNALTTVAGTQDHGTGADVRLDWRRGDVLGGSLSASLVSISSGNGQSHTTQDLYAVADLHVPRQWADGKLVGNVARDVSALLILRTTVGEAYTRLVNNGAGVIVPPDDLRGGNAIEPAGASRLPWTKTLDLRLVKLLRARGAAWTVFLDARNLLNWTNVTHLFAETGTVVNPLHRAAWSSRELSGLTSEAASNNALLADGTIDLHSCQSWTASEGAPVDCVALQRVEARFGNGDLLYSPAEQQRGMNAAYDFSFGPSLFYGPGRTLRLGLQLSF